LCGCHRRTCRRRTQCSAERTSTTSGRAPQFGGARHGDIPTGTHTAQMGGSSRCAPAGNLTKVEHVTLLERDREYESLGAFWGRARAGHGGMVIIAGEPGAGKTSLVQLFAQESA